MGELSILTSIKKLLGIPSEYQQFDQDIIIHINTALFTLTQIGIGPSAGFSISDATSKWKDFVSDSNLESVKTYVYLKVRVLFDPPTNSVVMEAFNRSINEYEWRLNISAEDSPESGE